MSRIHGGILVLVLHVSVASVQGEAQDKSATPAEQYQRLLKEYQRAASSGRVLTDEERLSLATVVFAFEETIYNLAANPRMLGNNGTIFFPNTTCTEPGFLDRADNTFSSIEISIIVPTTAGTQFWVQDGAATTGLLALSQTSNGPPLRPLRFVMLHSTRDAS